MPDIADLNPVFADKINGFLTAAQKAGVPAHIISGYRDNSKQAKLYANYQAKQAGHAIPYPEEGSGGVAAPPGGSMHNFGLATDVLANSGHQQDLIAFANAHPELGVKSLGAFDPPHFQLAGDQRTLMANPPQPAAGFTAPNLSAWLGGGAPTMEGGSPHLPAFHGGTTLTSNPVTPGPMDPSIMARGGVSSPSETPATPAVPAPTFVQNLGKGDVGAALQQLTANKTDKDGNEQPGTSALAGLAGIAKPKQQAAAPQPAMIQPAGDSTAAIGPAASQLFSTLLANSAKPLSWSTRPMGSDAGPQGTTLNGVPYV